MADYTITSTPDQELGINWQYDNYVNHEAYPTKEGWLQSIAGERLFNPMFANYERDHAIALDASLNTIPEAEQEAARVEIETVITSHGGTIVSATPPPPVIPAADSLLIRIPRDRV